MVLLLLFFKEKKEEAHSYPLKERVGCLGLLPFASQSYFIYSKGICEYYVFQENWFYYGIMCLRQLYVL